MKQTNPVLGSAERPVRWKKSRCRWAQGGGVPWVLDGSSAARAGPVQASGSSGLCLSRAPLCGFTGFRGHGTEREGSVSLA